MEFVTNPSWQVMFLLALISWLMLLFREIYRYRLLVSRFGIVTTFLAVILVIFWLSVIVTMLLKTGFFSAVITFVFFLLISSLIFIILNKSRSSFLHPESVAQTKYNKINFELMIQKINSRQELQQLLSKYEKTPDFLRDLMERFSRIGNYKALKRIKKKSNLQYVLEIYSRDDWTNEDKFIAASNFLEYGMK